MSAYLFVEGKSEVDEAIVVALLGKRAVAGAVGARERIKDIALHIEGGGANEEAFTLLQVVRTHHIPKVIKELLVRVSLPAS